MCISTRDFNSFECVRALCRSRRLVVWRAWILVCATIFPAPIVGQDGANHGREIAAEAARRNARYGDLTAGLTMVLRNRRGAEKVRTMEVRSLEGVSDGDRTLLIFVEPKDIAGTILLTHSHPEASDDQWVYLPALKRVRRIAGRKRSGSFMGSEFTYEDIAAQHVDKYEYRFLGIDTLAGRLTYRIERRPKDPDSGYRSQTVWFDRETYRPVQVHYYDANDVLLKTLRLTGYQKYLGRWWRPDVMEMVNHQTGKSTVLRWTSYTFQSGLSPRDFEHSNLRRVQ